MQKFLLIIIMLSVFKYADSTKFNPDTIYNINEVTVIVNKWDLLIQQIIEVESSNSINLVGDNGKAIGPMQIHPILVNGVNTILGYRKYKYSDRWDLNKSIEMFNIYQDYWNPVHNLELALRIWNSGPKGLDSTYNYLTDVYVNKFKI